jgi:hypothetical protein
VVEKRVGICTKSVSSEGGFSSGIIRQTKAARCRRIFLGLGGKERPKGDPETMKNPEKEGNLYCKRGDIHHSLLNMWGLLWKDVKKLAQCTYTNTVRQTAWRRSHQY